MELGVTGVTLNSTELYSKTLNLFTNVSGSPLAWNYTLSAGTPAINFGVNTNVGLTKDYQGKPIIGNPDAGILELE
jgi:hypothetical protein